MSNDKLLIQAILGTLDARRRSMSMVDRDYLRPKRLAHMKYKRMRMQDVIKEVEEGITNEEVKMVLDERFNGLGQRALELLKDAPMNR